MTTFYQVMLDHFQRANEALFAHGIETHPITPDLVSVVHCAYFDSSHAYVDEIERGKLVALVEVRDEGHLGDAPGDLQDTMRNILHHREIDVVWAGVGKDRTILNTILSSKNGFVVLCRECDTVDPRIYDAATLTLRLEVNSGVLHRVCKHFWPEDYDRKLNHGADAYTLTDVLVAARGATSSVNFFDRLYGPRKVDAEPKDAPAPVSRTKLSNMSGFGPARDWGLQLARDIADYRLGLIPWADVDSGLLLSSPPGGGKTMFAAALAAECECELVATSYSEWEGSDNRITKGMEKLFESIRKKAQDNVVIFFIDEIDSMGARGDNGHNESWWTAIINCLLSFLDGAKGRERIVVIAATNLPDRVDAALRRSGRLDRHIVIPPPNVKEIAGILAHHLVKDGEPRFAPEAYARAAVALRGRSPADIMQVARDARRYARKERRRVSVGDVYAVLPPARWYGDDDEMIAVHEAGHVVGVLNAGFPLVSVDADRCMTLSDQPHIVRARPFEDTIRLTLAGRAAEEVVLGVHGVGARADLLQATEYVRQLLFEMGGAGLVYRNAARPLWQEDYARIEEALAGYYGDAVGLVTRRKQHVLLIARALQERRYLNGSEVDAILSEFRRAFFSIVDERFDESDRLLGEAQESDPRRLREAA